MIVRDVMTAYPAEIAAATTLFKAAEKMKELNVGGLPVQRDDQVAGFITDRDIVIRALAQSRDPQNTTVGEIMSQDIVNCLDTESLNTAAQKMEDAKVRRLLVMNGKNELVGILSLGDLAARWDQDSAGEVISKVSEPSVPSR